MRDRDYWPSTVGAAHFHFVVDGPRLRWMVAIHLTFVVSGVLMALMDWIASKTEKYVPSER